MATILLTDAQQRKTLSAARALGRAGHRVLVAEVTRFATARFSRHTAMGLVSPDPAREPEAFLGWLRDAVRRYRVDCVLPMDDFSTEAVVGAVGDAACPGPAVAAGGSLSALGAATLVPTVAQFRAGRDKAATMELARRAGVRAPRSVQSLREALDGGLGWPVVLKARRASGARGLVRASNPAQLAEAWRRLNGADSAPLLQEYIRPGRKFDVCLLFTPTGKPVASFVQEELRGYPLWGGPSTLQESVRRPDLTQLVLRLVESVGWRGVLEAEFMEDPTTGEPVLMEINPRFWASLELAVRCGINFPLWTVQLALGEQPIVPDQYAAGIRCRNLLPGDCLHYIANPRRGQMSPGFWRPLDHRTYDDILSAEDPAPALGFGLACLRYLFDGAMWRTVIRRCTTD